MIRVFANENLHFLRAYFEFLTNFPSTFQKHVNRKRYSFFSGLYC